MSGDQQPRYDEYALRLAAIVECEGAQRDESSTRQLHRVVDFGPGRHLAPVLGGSCEAVGPRECQPQHFVDADAAAIAAHPHQGVGGVSERDEVWRVGERPGHRPETRHLRFAVHPTNLPPLLGAHLRAAQAEGLAAMLGVAAEAQHGPSKRRLR